MATPSPAPLGPVPTYSHHNSLLVQTPQEAACGAVATFLEEGEPERHMAPYMAALLRTLAAALQVRARARARRGFERRQGRGTPRRGTVHMPATCVQAPARRVTPPTAPASAAAAVRAQGDTRRLRCHLHRGRGGAGPGGAAGAGGPDPAPAVPQAGHADGRRPRAAAAHGVPHCRWLGICLLWPAVCRCLRRIRCHATWSPSASTRPPAKCTCCPACPLQWRPRRGRPARRTRRPASSAASRWWSAWSRWADLLWA